MGPCRAKCVTLGSGEPMDRDYSFIGMDARGTSFNAFAYKGFKLGGVKYKKTKASSVKSCVKKCLANKDCYSFQYDAKRRNCSFSKKGVDFGGKKEAAFCTSKDRYVAGWIIDADD